MFEWRNAKVTSNVRKTFEIATDIAWLFDDIKVRSAYLLFAAMNIDDSAVSKVISDMYESILPDLESILQSKDIFAQIFGEEMAEKKFAFAVDVESQQEANDINQLEREEINRVFVGGIKEKPIDLETMKSYYSDNLESAMDDAYCRCMSMKYDCLDLDVIIYCILQNKETSAFKFITNIVDELEIDIDEFMENLKLVSNISEMTTIENIITIPRELETCLEILNDKYVKGVESPILGRDREIFKAFNVFSKKTKRNAVLVGRPGVGKTAIIEAITQEIVNESCPKEFCGYTVLSLDVNSMVAGTKYRGDFEAKVSVLIKFLESSKKIILFVDEMHQMINAGSSSEGNLDLCDSLKPILSRGNVIFVGATTIDEYNTILARDGAFKRRFEVISINEPKQHEVKHMIKAKILEMEKYHSVKLPTNLVDYIILCSNCFNFECANPDKTIDLCDRSMAIAKMEDKKTVTKKHINMVYEEFFEKYNKIAKREVMATAYHEIGHYITTRLTKEHRKHNITAISIIPTSDYVGVNFLEITDNIVSCDMEYVEAYLMSLLAGRVAQFRVTKTIDSGASNDLQKAKQFARSVITDFGMDEGEYKNICLIEEDIISERMVEEINHKVNTLIKRICDKTESFITQHWDEIDDMAKYLMKKQIVTSDELEIFIRN